MIQQILLTSIDQWVNSLSSRNKTSKGSFIDGTIYMCHLYVEIERRTVCLKRRGKILGWLLRFHQQKHRKTRTVQQDVGTSRQSRRSSIKGTSTAEYIFPPRLLLSFLFIIFMDSSATTTDISSEAPVFNPTVSNMDGVQRNYPVSEYKDVIKRSLEESCAQWVLKTEYPPKGKQSSGRLHLLTIVLAIA